MSERCPDVCLQLVSDPRCLCVVRGAIAAAADSFGFGKDEIHKIMLAVDEALANVIRHGYDGRDDGPIEVTVGPLDPVARRGCRVVIEDRAKQVDPEAIRGRELAEVRPGGLGVHIIRRFMDEARYEPRPGGGMRLTMTLAGVDTATATPDSDAHA